MRGRGLMNQNRSDPFRSRPPNTSRPPSMHVDDFIKMEKNRSHSPSPQGQHPQGGPPRRMDKVVYLEGCYSEMDICKWPPFFIEAVNI